jgi:uncharacterized membrane protein
VIIKIKKGEKKMKNTIYHSIKDIPLITFIVMIIISFLGAIINYKQRDLENKTLLNKIAMFILEFITSFTLSIITFAILIGLGYNEFISVGLAGFVATQGIKILYKIEKAFVYKFLGKDAIDIIYDKDKEK